MLVAVPVMSLLVAALIGYLLARHTGKGVLILWALVAIAGVWLLVSASLATGEYAGLGEMILFFLVWLPVLFALIVATIPGRILRLRARRVGVRAESVVTQSVGTQSVGVESGAPLR